MKAGRELDALIAEKVMGLKTPPNERCSCTNSEWLCRKHGTFPRYSTSIADAWEVVEKLGDKDFRVEKDYDFEFWICILGNRRREVRGTTAPHAICLAALSQSRAPAKV